MFCRICGKPTVSGKCLYCGCQTGLQANLNLSGTGFIDKKEANGTSVGGESFVDESISGIDLNAQGANSISVSADNQLATTGMVLAICSIFFFLLSIPSLIVSIMALTKAKSLNGAGRSKAIVGVVMSSVLTALTVLYIVAVIVIVPLVFALA